MSASHPLATRNRWDTMTTRTKQLLQRSRDLLERSRVAAVQFLDQPRATTTALPRVIEGSRESMIHTEPEGAVVDICASIALRDLNLVDSLLSLLESMEESEVDPDRLTELYKLDHLAARLRRNAENLRVLAGRDASDAVSDSASLVDVIRAAMSSIDGYSRVSIGRVLSLGVTGIAADDLSRLLAELLDNGAKQSPPDTTVRVSAHLTDSGSVLMRIEDDGIGLPAERIAELNGRLSDEPRLNDDSVRHMGLAVVRRLAARHDMRVRLDRRAPHGTTATVLLPAGLVCELPGESWSGSRTVMRPANSPRPQAPEPDIVPAARRPPPRPAAEQTRTTAGGLPKRTPTGGRVATRAPSPQDLTEQGRTVNGLPRRVSRSIKSPEHGDEPRRTPATPEEERAGHEQLLADLDAFAEGEQAAKEAAWPDAADAGAVAAPATQRVAEPDAPDGTAADHLVDAAAERHLASGVHADTPASDSFAATDPRAAQAVTASGPFADPAPADAPEVAAPLAPETGVQARPEADPGDAPGAADRSAPPEAATGGFAPRSISRPADADAPAWQAPESEPMAEPELVARPELADPEQSARQELNVARELVAGPELMAEPELAESEPMPESEPMAESTPMAESERTAESEPMPEWMAAPEGGLRPSPAPRHGVDIEDPEPAGPYPTGPYPAERYAAEPYTAEHHPAEPYPAKPYPAEPYAAERYPSEPLSFEPLRPAAPPGYAPDSMFDASADTPTPPRGFEAPIQAQVETPAEAQAEETPIQAQAENQTEAHPEPDRGRDQQPGGATP